MCVKGGGGHYHLYYQLFTSIQDVLLDNTLPAQRYYLQHTSAYEDLKVIKIIKVY